MCGIVAQWLRFWAVNQETMGSNPAYTIVIFYVFFVVVDMSTRSTNVEYCCFFSNVLLKLQPFSH